MIKIDRMVGRTSRSRIRILARTSVIGEGAIRCFVSKRFVGKIIGRGERERERDRKRDTREGRGSKRMEERVKEKKGKWKLQDHGWRFAFVLIFCGRKT